MLAEIKAGAARKEGDAQVVDSNKHIVAVMFPFLARLTLYL
jgi:hypothetical protein